jgi:hypothetical protein
MDWEHGGRGAERNPKDSLLFKDLQRKKQLGRRMSQIPCDIREKGCCMDTASLAFA